MRAMFKIDNINDSRNCLFMYRPVEWAFDNSRLCVEVTRNGPDEIFTWRLLDERLRSDLMCTKAEELLQSNYVRPHYRFLPTTFGDIDGKPVHFYNKNRPYRRLLAFQAVIAYKHAKVAWPEHCPDTILKVEWSHEDLAGKSFVENEDGEDKEGETSQ